MTTYAVPQYADLHRLTQKPALIPENLIKTCDTSLLQMSETPFQQWTYISDDKYTNTRTYTSDDDRQRQMAVSSPPYLTPDPYRFLQPITQAHGPTNMQNASYPRFPTQGRAWDSGSDSKHKFTATTGSLAQYSIQQPSVSGSVEHAGASSSYYDASSRSRGSISSIGRINDVDSQYSSSSATFPSPVHSEKGSVVYPATARVSSYQQPPTHQRNATSGVPSGFENLLHHSPTPPPPPRRTSALPRYRLSIRQQPIAARACGAGDRDRRPVDPPPVIQLLLTDFNPGSEEDRSILQDPRFTVGCLLYPFQDPSWGFGSSNPMSHQERTNLGINLEDSNAPGQSTPLLSGKSFVSPFYVDEEPDPDTAPSHPSTDDHKTGAEMTRTLTENPRGGPSPASPRPPASFFIFSDLSVRTAGMYRLQFRLMNWGNIEDTGVQSMSILAEAWSDPFRVYPAKNFPGMRDSSLLTVRLKELGFVELKTRGKGMGKGRRVRNDDLRAQ